MSKWKIAISIDKKINIPIYKQISQAIIRGIESSRLTSGTVLPGSRTLAEILKINRNTVVQAYDDLHAQGWIDFQQGMRPKISVNIQAMTSRTNTESLKNSVRAEVTNFKLKLTDGLPDSRLFPMDNFLRTFGRATRLYGRRLYTEDLDPQGACALRDSLSEMLRLTRGMNVLSEEILITRGSLQGIYLLGLALKSLGAKTIVIESPGYGPAVKSFELAGLAVEGIKIDTEGFDVDELERKLKRGKKISAVYLTPHHQYPTTVMLKANRRLKLLELAERYNFWLIEDDYDHDFHYDTSPVLPIFSLRSEKVIYLGSLTKVLSRGLRIGYIVAPHEILKEMLGVKFLVDKVGDPLLERAVAEFINDGDLFRHINKMRMIYKERRDILWSELKDYSPQLLKPHGGMAFWLPVKNYKTFSHALEQQGIRTVPEQQTANFKDPKMGVRIGFANLNESEMKILVTGIKKISF